MSENTVIHFLELSNVENSLVLERRQENPNVTQHNNHLIHALGYYKHIN